MGFDGAFGNFRMDCVNQLHKGWDIGAGIFTEIVNVDICTCIIFQNVL